MYHKIIGLGGTLLLGAASLLWMTAPVLARGGHGGGGHGGGGHGGFGGGHGGFGGGHGGFGRGRGGFGGWNGGWHDRDWGHRGWYGGYYPGYGAYYDSEDYPYSPFYGYGNYQPDDYGSSISPDSGSASAYWSGTSAAPVAQDNTARVKVLVLPDAQVWIANQPTRAKGSERDYVSPPLEPTRNYTYDIRARWNEGGHEVEQTRTAEVHAGRQTTVDFRAPAPSQREKPARTGTSGS